MTNPTANHDAAEAVVAELVDLLRLERLEDNLFRGQSRDIGTKYVFGGQVLGQSLSAAQQTVDDDRVVHSLHAYFLRAGDVNHPRSEEHTSELQSLMRISYAVFCLKKKRLYALSTAEASSRNSVDTAVLLLK